MITEKELIDAISACEQEPLTPSKVSKLADFYIIYDHLFGAPVNSMMSFKDEPPEKTLNTSGKTEFLKAIDGRPADRILDLISELVESVKILHPQMYQHLLDRIYNE